MKLENILRNIPRVNQHKHFKNRINKSRLPHPITFYKNLGFTLKTGTTWQAVKCPFHDDKNPSMAINAPHGGYKCHACGETGDMLRFYMKLYQLDFMVACERLGLLEEVKR